jgi:hypothetical protein
MCVRHSTKKLREVWAQRYWEALPKAQRTIIELAEKAEEKTVRLRAAQHIEERTVGPVTQQYLVDARVNDPVWGGGFEGVKWISVAEDDESAEAEANLHATTQLQVEAGQPDEDVEEALPGVVEAELVEEDDPWAPAATAKTTERARVAAYEAELRERQKPLRSRRR